MFVSFEKNINLASPTKFKLLTYPTLSRYLLSFEQSLLSPVKNNDLWYFEHFNSCKVPFFYKKQVSFPLGKVSIKALVSNKKFPHLIIWYFQFSFLKIFIIN